MREERGRIEHVVGQDLGPQILDFFRLREEAVAADVEVIALVPSRARDAADVLGIGFEHRDRHALLGEEVRGGQPGGAGADDADAHLIVRAQSSRRGSGPAATPPAA